jgi:DNA-binding transcriptional regulator YiaG
MYHYTESGLDNVWLDNGYTKYDTPYGKGVAVNDADELLAAIALSLTAKEGSLTGKEFRFLRLSLGLSQPNAAKMLGVTEQAVSLWERTGKVPKQGDALLRLLVLEKQNGGGKASEMIERINTVDRLMNQQIIAKARSHKWTTKRQAEAPELETA